MHLISVFECRMSRYSGFEDYFPGRMKPPTQHQGFCFPAPSVGYLVCLDWLIVTMRISLCISFPCMGLISSCLILKSGITGPQAINIFSFLESCCKNALQESWQIFLMGDNGSEYIYSYRPLRKGAMVRKTHLSNQTTPSNSHTTHTTTRTSPTELGQLTMPSHLAVLIEPSSDISH